MKQSFGEWLRTAREAKGLPLREVCRACEIAPSYLSDIENDRRTPGDDVMEKLAAAVGVDFEDAMARAGRLGVATERYLRRKPEAVRLVRSLAAGNWTDEQIRALRASVEAGR